VYVYYYSEDQSLSGYTNWSLSEFRTSDFPPDNRPPGEAVCKYVQFIQFRLQRIGLNANIISTDSIALYTQTVFFYNASIMTYRGWGGLYIEILRRSVAKNVCLGPLPQF